MQVMSVPKFERFFRVAAGLDIDKTDLKRFSDFINRKICDLLLRAQAAAKANGRDVIEPFDLPITKGLQECLHEFPEARRGNPARAHPGSPDDAPATRPGLRRGDRGPAPRGRGRPQCGARPHLQNHRSKSEESPVRALGVLLPDLRPAAVDPCHGRLEPRRASTASAAHDCVSAQAIRLPATVDRPTGAQLLPERFNPGLSLSS